MLTTNDGRVLIARSSETEAGQMRITILKNTVCAGVMARAGDVVEAPERDANYLIGLGFARVCAEPEPEPEPVIRKGKKNARS